MMSVENILQLIIRSGIYGKNEYLSFRRLRRLPERVLRTGPEQPVHGADGVRRHGFGNRRVLLHNLLPYRPNRTDGPHRSYRPYRSDRSHRSKRNDRGNRPDGTHRPNRTGCDSGGRRG